MNIEIIECDVTNCFNTTERVQSLESGWVALKITFLDRLITSFICPDHKLNIISSRSLLTNAIVGGVGLMRTEEQND